MSVVMTWWPVAPELAGLVDAIYVFRARGPARRALAGAILPQVQWRLRGEYAWRCHDGELQPTPLVSALGPPMAAVTLETIGETVVVGTGLFPEGWATLLPMPAGSVADRVLDLGALWGAGADVPLASGSDQSDQDLARALESLLRERVAGVPAADPRVTAISRWANGDTHDIDALAATLGVSTRTAERLCVAACGLPPRQLANRHRILRMAAVLALGIDNRRETWTQDYADQSHFIRNFKRYVGVSPTRFLREPDLLVREVMRARLAIASAHPLGLAPNSERPAAQPSMR